MTVDDVLLNDTHDRVRESVTHWMRSTTGDGIAANRDAVLQRGQAQVR